MILGLIHRGSLIQDTCQLTERLTHQFVALTESRVFQSKLWRLRESVLHKHEQGRGGQDDFGGFGFIILVGGGWEV